MDWKDAVEFMLAGATAIQIGTANFIDPAVTIKVEGRAGVMSQPDKSSFTTTHRKSSQRVFESLFET